MNAHNLVLAQWKNFTDMKSVRSVFVQGQTVAAATAGGLFLYDIQNGSFSTALNSDGISSNDLTAAFIDTQGRIWVGASDGSLSVRDPGTLVWSTITAIAQSTHLHKGIERFMRSGDTLFVASQFGISVYRISSADFGDTYAYFGFLPSPTVTDAILQGNRIWVGTDAGVVTAVLTPPNVSSWTHYDSLGPSSSFVTALALFHDTLVVATNTGAAFFAGGSFQNIPSLSGIAISSLTSSASNLFIAVSGNSNFSLQSLSGLEGALQTVATSDSTTAGSLALDQSASAPAMLPWTGTGTKGIAFWDGNAWEYRAPNGPQSNLFTSLVVDASGVLWCGTGINGGGTGFYRYNPSLPENARWKNFTSAVYPIMEFDDYYKTSLGAPGSVWVSSWGRGAVEVRGDTIRRRIDVTSTPAFFPTLATDPLFVVAGGAATDEAGKTWFCNRTAVNGDFVAQLVNDTTFAYFRNLYNTSDGIFQGVVVDQNGTKWFANSEPTAKSDRGLYFFNETGAVAGTEDTGGWGYFSTADGLPNNSVISLAVDQDGEVWVGTDLGATIITNPLAPKTQYISVFPLREQSVQTIAVDAVNNKWVGTKEGVFVLSPDGTQLLQLYNGVTTNGELVDNDVRSIAIDQKRGIVYMGTENGLSSLAIAAVASNATFTSLQFGPNPFVIPTDAQLTIQNLIANCTIKILTVTGRLVSEFKAQGGGRAFWDGRNRSGQLVSSGVYFIVAYTNNGDQLTTGKIAVIRK